jgi:phage anti-repressor protein
MSNKKETKNFLPNLAKSSDSQDLVPVEVMNSQMLVDSRVLHQKLGVVTRYNDWISRQITRYDFQEGVDFYSNLSKSRKLDYSNLSNQVGTWGGNRRAKNLFLTVEMAKELAMFFFNKSLVFLK